MHVIHVFSWLITPFRVCTNFRVCLGSSRRPCGDAFLSSSGSIVVCAYQRHPAALHLQTFHYHRVHLGPTYQSRAPVEITGPLAGESAFFYCPQPQERRFNGIHPADKSWDGGDGGGCDITAVFAGSGEGGVMSAVTRIVLCLCYLSLFYWKFSR